MKKNQSPPLAISSSIRASVSLATKRSTKGRPYRLERVSAKIDPNMTPAML
jgi:hypothetical protein